MSYLEISVIVNLVLFMSIFLIVDGYMFYCWCLSEKNERQKNEYDEEILELKEQLKIKTFYAEKVVEKIGEVSRYSNQFLSD